VPLDATMDALLTADDVALAAEGRTLAARFLTGPMGFYGAFYAERGAVPPGTMPCHDLLAVMVATDPTYLLEAPVAPLAVDTGGSAAWGTTVADLRASPQDTTGAFHPWSLGLRADVERFRAGFRALCGS
jgi:purine nucleosidase